MPAKYSLVIGTKGHQTSLCIKNKYIPQ